MSLNLSSLMSLLPYLTGSSSTATSSSSNSGFTVVDGGSGPYSNCSTLGKSANTGYRVGNLFDGDSIWQKEDYKVKFTSVKTSYTTEEYEDDDGELQTRKVASNHLNSKGTLAYSTQLLKSYDKAGTDGTKDGKVSTAEMADKMSISAEKAAAIDIDGNGFVTAGEFSAWTYYQDGLKYDDDTEKFQFSYDNQDGQITSQQSLEARTQIKGGVTTADLKAQLKEIYDDKIKDSEDSFEMPDEVDTDDETSTSSSNILQLLLQMLCGGSGGSSSLLSMLFGGLS